MKLSLKQKAFTQTLGMVLLAGLAGVSVGIIVTVVPPAIVPYLLLAIFLVICFKVLYSINVNRLEYQEKLKEMTEKKA